MSRYSPLSRARARARVLRANTGLVALSCALCTIRAASAEPAAQAPVAPTSAEPPASAGAKPEAKALSEPPGASALSPEPEPPAPAQTLPSAATPPRALLDPSTSAHVSMRSDYPGSAIELRRFGTFDSWQRACVAPCDRRFVVSGMEVRVVAPGMTPSKAFRIDPGAGSALLSVDGGSASALYWGKTALFASIAPAFLGMSLYGFGAYEDREELKIGGGVLLGLGTALVLAALPLVVSGSTEVTNADGDLVGDASPSGAF